MRRIAVQWRCNHFLTHWCTMFHLAAFYSSIALNSVYAQVNAVADGGLTRNGSNQYIMPANMTLLAAAGQGVTTSRMQIQAPSLRNIGYPEIYPITVGAITTVPTLPAVEIYDDHGPRLLMNEQVGVYASEGGTGASPTVAGLWMTDRPQPAPGGMVTTVVATGNITLVAQQWVLGTPTFETQLGAGRYAIVGMAAVMASCNFIRLVFPGQTNYRPGVIPDAAYGNKAWRDSFRNGRLGLFGVFDFNVPPQVEAFGSAAGATAFTLFLDLVKIG